MSDGERAIFYLIGQCLAVPPEHIIIVDEPELHLHRSLQASLWSAIESERPDCLLVYLTHDLDFAATRSGATKIWLKSYDGKAWDWHLIPPEDDVIPERILLEILGSRKPVLFCEGEKENLDFLLFSHVYDDFAVVPCGSCGDVIHATTTFSRMKILHDLECRGIIDRDYRTDEEVEHIRKMGVHALDVSEIENVLLTEPVLRVVAENLLLDPASIILQAKEIVFRRLKDEKDRLALRMTRALVESKLGNFDTKAQESSGLEADLQSYIREIDIQGLYTSNLKRIDEVIATQDYLSALRIYNQKGLLAEIARLFDYNQRNWVDYVRRLLTKDRTPSIRKALLQVLPSFPVAQKQITPEKP
jgi:hypothetical protein